MLKALAIAVLLLMPSAASAATVEDVDKSISHLLGDPAAFHDAFVAIQQAVDHNRLLETARDCGFPVIGLTIFPLHS